jgi:gliding motility-associated-like protein
MKANIFNKILFSFVLTLACLAGYAQNDTADRTVLIIHDEYRPFCGKANPIDLFKYLNAYISPEYGYWGDVYGNPYNGKASALPGVPERPYTSGNIFNPAKADTGYYAFYFYITSNKLYCGLKTGERLMLDLHYTEQCWDSIKGKFSYHFCYGANYDDIHDTIFGTVVPIPFEDLIMHEWRKDTANNGAGWVSMEVYRDSLYLDLIQSTDYNVDLAVNTSPADMTKNYVFTYYVLIRKMDMNYVKFRMNIEVERPKSLEIIYKPDKADFRVREFGFDDEITLSVLSSPEDSLNLEHYNYFINGKNLNKYLFGGNDTHRDVNVSVLSFSGMEDFIEVIATTDKGCIARAEDNVIVNVPTPTVFTPDGDGINDVFFGGEKFRNREFHLEIFNRWGNRLYFGESGWDGMYKGIEAPAGTYFYAIHLKQSDGTTTVVKGSVTLVRNRP